MAFLSEDQRQHILALLESNQALPAEYKPLLFPSERQEYELVYAEKEREEDILAETMAVPLQPIRSFGSNEQGWHNLLIFGDNLQAMKTLLRMKEQGNLLNTDGTPGVRLVYIDPPFATKQEFAGSEGERAYQDKVAGARFIEFLRKRLLLLKHILADGGIIYVHLDWKKAHYVKIILDELFIENNFLFEVCWLYENKPQDSRKKRLPRDIDFLLVYKKGGNEHTHHPIYIPTAHPRKQNKVIKQDGKRVSARDENGNVIYEMREEKLLGSVWNIPLVNPNGRERIGYPTQKPEELLAAVIKTSSNPGDIILDAFAGSGTTLAVAEKLGRRWIGIDCGKLAIYTIQKRLLNLKSEIGNKGKALKPKPFILYNAGLYEFSRLRDLSWESWCTYALSLFQCRDEMHIVSGISLDGYRGGDDVLVFNHRLNGGAVLDYGFVEDLHTQLRDRASTRFFIIAPAASVAFLEDYVEKGRFRYYILRIPYSIINELHTRDFTALIQPVTETDVNATVEAVGFDFIRQPKVICDYFLARPKGELFQQAVVKINTFISQALTKGATQKGNLETLSMVLVDYDYPFDPVRKGKKALPPFEMDAVFYASDIQAANWEVRMPVEALGQYVMLVYLDIYGNEYTEVKAKEDFRGHHA